MATPRTATLPRFSRTVLQELDRVLSSRVPPPAAPSGMVPLTDLGTGSYKGYQGGLYPGGQNSPPPAYLAAGIAAADTVKPINGKIVVLCQGFSNPHQEFPPFQALAASDPGVADGIVAIDGAAGGMDAWAWGYPTANRNPWPGCEAALKSRGLTNADVQVIWFKTARIQGLTFPAWPLDAQNLCKYTRTWVAKMEATYPNLKLIYVGSRTWAGNALVGISTEPHAYQGGFAVKWLIEERITGAVKGKAHLQWGPYLWAAGDKPRADGLTWPKAGFDKDGVHPGPAMEAKVGQMLLDFFKTDPTSRPWFPMGGGA